MADDESQRVTDLEVRIAYPDRTIAVLDEVVRDLGSRVAALEAALAQLRRDATAPPVTGLS
jgi:uncharacterized coiled-coil protein SlyX